MPFYARVGLFEMGRSGREVITLALTAVLTLIPGLLAAGINPRRDFARHAAVPSFIFSARSIWRDAR